MRLNTFIKKLQKLADKHGNVPVTIHTDSHEGDGEFKTDKFGTICWCETVKGKTKVTEVMLADQYTMIELS